MRNTHLRLLSDDERNILYDMMQEEEDDNESSYRAKIILLKDEGRTVPEIRKATNQPSRCQYKKMDTSIQ